MCVCVCLALTGCATNEFEDGEGIYSNNNRKKIDCKNVRIFVLRMTDWFDQLNDEH